MSLNNPNANTITNAAFESEAETDLTTAEGKTLIVDALNSRESGKADHTVAHTTEASPATAPVQAAEETNDIGAQSTTAIAPAKSFGLAAPRPGSRQELMAQSNVIELDMRNALPVTWEDFTAINASQGEFQIKGETPKQIGKEVTLKLVSFQDQWVSAPKDNDAEGDDLVRYSDDGVYLNDDSGRTLAEHQKSLTDAGEEPTKSHRVVIVGELQACGEAGMDEVGNLVQVILSDTARRNFTSHTKQVAYQIANGRMSKSDAEMMKMTATLAGSGKKTYTLVKCGYADGFAPKKGGTPEGVIEG